MRKHCKCYVSNWLVKITDWDLITDTFTVFSHVTLLCTQCFYTSTIPVAGSILAGTMFSSTYDRCPVYPHQHDLGST